MEYIIKELQVITSYNQTINTASVIHYINSNPKFYSILAKDIKDRFQSSIEYNNFAIATELGNLYFYEQNVFNSAGRLIGTYGYLNGYITNHLSISKLSQHYELFLKNDIYLCPKFVAALNKYSQIEVNLLSEQMFNNLCNAKINVPSDERSLKQAMEYYLSSNFGKVENLSLLKDETTPPDLFASVELPEEVHDVEFEEEIPYVDTDEFEEDEGVEDTVEEEFALRYTVPLQGTTTDITASTATTTTNTTVIPDNLPF